MTVRVNTQTAHVFTVVGATLRLLIKSGITVDLYRPITKMENVLGRKSDEALLFMSLILTGYETAYDG